MPPLLTDFHVADETVTNVMVLHGDLQPNSPYNALTTDEIAAGGLDYLALGHVHAMQVGHAGATTYAYPGCLMGRGFDECGAKGALRVTIEEKQVRTEFVPVAGRTYEILSVAAGDDPLAAIRAALPYMKQGGGGRIVNSTSSSIKQELDNLILSNTFRMGVVGMSKTMAREFGPYNIMVNTMGPGRIYTDRIKYLNTIRAEKAGITLEEYNTRDAASFPQKRYQTADEYARSVVFICSPANSAISGQVICVDGAMTTAY